MVYTSRGGPALIEWLDRLTIRGITLEFVDDAVVVHLNGTPVNQNRRNNVEEWANNFDFSSISWVN